MKRTFGPAVAGALAALAAMPVAVFAHSGHAGDHGFLYAALQPLLGADHFLAGVIVAVTGGVAFAALGRAIRTSRRTFRS